MATFSLGLDFSQTTVEAPILTDHGAQVKINESGCCAKHPDILLRKKLKGMKKFRNGGDSWEVVRNSCYKCDSLHALDVQERANEVEAQKKEMEVQQQQEKARMAMENLKLQHEWKAYLTASNNNNNNRSSSTLETSTSTLDASSSSLVHSSGAPPPTDETSSQASSAEGTRTSRFANLRKSPRLSAASSKLTKVAKNVRNNQVVLLAGEGLQKLNDMAAAARPPVPSYVTDMPCQWDSEHGFYTGEINMNTSKPNGTGKWTAADKSAWYDGEWKEGKAHGNGKCTVPGVYEYQGQMVDDECEGEGFFVDKKDGRQYEGHFKKSNFHGHGLMAFSNGNKYDGSWKMHEMDGQGVFTWADGTYFIGSFKGGKKHGRGVYYYWRSGKKKQERQAWFNGVQRR